MEEQILSRICRNLVSYFWKDVQDLERVQTRFTRMDPEIEAISETERLDTFGLFSEVEGRPIRSI